MEYSKHYIMQSIMAKNYHSIYANSAALSAHSSKINGLLFSQESSPMIDYLNNFCKEYQADYEQCIFDFSSQPSNLFSSINNSQKEEIYENTLFLPKPQKIKASLDEVLFLRNSSESFSDKSMFAEKLSSLLFYAYGSHCKKRNPFGDTQVIMHTRTYGSGGGLYPISVYMLVKNITNISKGIYLYQPVSHTIRKVSDFVPIEDLIATNNNDSRNVNNCSIVFFYSYNMGINYLKYGELGLILSVIEAGSMLQNAHLVATSLNLTFCGWGGIKKSSIERHLGFKNTLNHVVSAAILGEKENEL